MLMEKSGRGVPSSPFCRRFDLLDFLEAFNSFFLSLSLNVAVVKIRNGHMLALMRKKDKSFAREPF